jgi:peptidoglycan/xylan/chitin deacetylase (PgdA/CDA1 family)
MTKLLRLSPLLFAFAVALITTPARGQLQTFEIHDRLVSTSPPVRQLALTLDACTGRYDNDLLQFLIRYRIPATIFATKKWLDANPRGVSIIKAHLDLFDVEDHGENHIPAVIGAGRKVYGIPGEPDIVHLRREVSEGARAIEAVIGIAPHWYRGATAVYDAQAIDEIGRMGYRIAGFSVNADAGATLREGAIIDRLTHVQTGDVIIAHMNKPASDTAEGLSVGLKALLDRGFVFVRLDQGDLQLQMLPTSSGTWRP